MFPSSARCAQLRRKAESRFYCIELFATTEYRGIAQLVEQRSPKPRVQSSSLCAPAKTNRHPRMPVCFNRDTGYEGLSKI